MYLDFVFLGTSLIPSCIQRVILKYNNNTTRVIAIFRCVVFVKVGKTFNHMFGRLPSGYVS